MVTKAYFTEQPDDIKYMRLPSSDTADLWLRKNIAEVTDPETGAVSYEADEAYMRTTATEAEITADFDAWYETASAWEPPAPEKKPDTQEERIAALEEAVEQLKENSGGASGTGNDNTAEIEAISEELQALKIVLGVE